MSKTITCPNCQAANTPGSKFCNNCGNRLPPSTSLICPNCNTPNPRDRFYCDNCGSRLVKDQKEPAQEPEEKPSLNTGSFFSLPARPPGQTGDLDPLQIVPDWLRKQAEEAGEDIDSEEDLRLRMPKIEEIGPLEKTTDDLPDWLVDEEDSDAIIGSPRVITTEHYMNLVDPPAKEADAELDQVADTADLPDWLNNLTEAGEVDEVTHSDDLSTPDDALNEWLESISGDEPESDDLADPQEDEEITTDWLFNAAVETSEPETTPPDTDSLSGLEADDEALGGEMFDWLAENLVDTGSLDPLDPSVVSDFEVTRSETDDDWLADFNAEDEDEALALPDDDDDSGDLADWPTDKDFGETDLSSLADLTDAVAQQDMQTEDAELADWISEITDQEEAPAADTPDVQPDWMAEFTTADSETFAEEIESKLEALEEDGLTDPILAADVLADLAEDDTAVSPESLPDWLSDLGSDETLVVETDERADGFTDLFAAADEPPLAGEDESDLDVDTAVAETDWLTEMVRMGDDAFGADDAEEVEGTAVAAEPDLAASPDSITAEPADLFAADWPEEEPEDEDTILESPSDWMAGDTMLAEALDEEMPDWLDELGTAADTAAEEEAAIPTGESLPAWIAKMKPGSGFSGAGLSDTGGLSELTDSYTDLADDTVATELPDWLEDVDEIGPSGDLVEESTDIPEWLADSIPADAELSSLSGKLPESDDEWLEILQGLPPALPIEERVFQADVPDWIMALKPTEIVAEPVIQEGGPLSGIRDVIGIETAVTETQVNGSTPAFTVSPEQTAQATLLKQLTLADKASTQAFARIDTSSNGLVRMLLAGLLLAAIVLGLLQPNLLRVTPNQVPAHLSLGYDTIESFAGEPVLLAVEYTPAMAGELDAQLEMLLTQLADNGSPVITVSQSAAGTAVIEKYATDIPTLGLLPGQAVGLRQLGDCLAGKTDCTTLAGRTLTGSLSQSLGDVALVIVLTGERDSLVDWAEQATLSGEIPVVAGVTQSLVPVALPYLDTEQLWGMIGGLPDTAVYQQQLLNQTPDAAIMRQLSAQTLTQLLAAVLLLAGGLIFGIPHLLQRDGES